MESTRAIAAVVAALALAGCGGGEDGGADVGAGAAAEGGAVEVVATDFAFDPETVELASRSATIRVVNEGDAPHALTLEGPDASTETLQPGGSGEVEVDLEAGEYTFYCPIGNHRDLGMEGSLTVE